jgi:hypothetical protein
MTMPMALPPAAPGPPLGDRLIAIVAHVLVYVLIRLPFPTLRSALGWVGERCARDATPAEAEIAVAAARWAGHWMPGRAACLENAVTAMLTAAARRRRVRVCVGARTQPYAVHAWTATEAGPAGEPDDLPDRPYELLYRI